MLKPSCYFLINMSKEEGETCLIHAANTWEASTQLLSSSRTAANLRPLLSPFSNGSSFLSLLNSLYFSPYYYFPCFIQALCPPQVSEYITPIYLPGLVTSKGRLLSPGCKEKLSGESQNLCCTLDLLKSEYLRMEAKHQCSLIDLITQLSAF